VSDNPYLDSADTLAADTPAVVAEYFVVAAGQAVAQPD
jgi:hypothetical protein